MAKTNRTGSSDESGFVRRTLAAASLVTALSGAANAQGNKAPETPDSDSAQVVQTVKDKAGVQLANELGLGFSDEDLRKVNASGSDFSSKGNGYSTPKKEAKPLRFEEIPPVAQSGISPSIRPVPQLSFSTENGDRIGGMFDPASGQAGASYESAGKYRADFGLIKSMGTIKDNRLKASFQALYAASQLGTYVGIEKGSELSKFVVAQGFKVEGGKLQITAAVLKRIVDVSFTEVDSPVVMKPQLTQKALGVDYTKGFSRESIIQELKTSVVYYDVDGKNLGTVGHVVVDTPTSFDQTRVDGGVRGGKKLLAEVAAVVKITDTVRADVSLGAEHIRYDQMFDTPAKSKTGATGSLGLTYQPTQHDKLSVKGRASGTGTGVDLKYEHDFGNGVSAFVEAGRQTYSTGIMPETRVMAGINMALDGKGRGTKIIPPLYTDWADKTALTLADLNPNPLVATDTIQVMERVIYREHEIRIDKTVLPGTSFLEKNADGTLKALDVDTGANNLVSVSASNLPSPYSGYLSVSGGRYLRIANLKEFAKIAPLSINASLADNVGTFTLVSVAVQKGSSVIANVIERVNGVSSADAAAFVAGTKTIAQIIAGFVNTAPTETDVVAQTFNEDGSVTVNVTVGDAQTPAGSLVFTASSSNATLFPAGSVVLGGSGANRTITLNPAANSFGTATVTYVVSDGALSVTKSFLVTVNFVNHAPAYQSAQGNITLTQSSAMTAATLPAATDVDVGQTLTYSATGLPAGLSFNPATRQVSGTPTATGTSTVTYSVSDGTLTTSQTFQVIVNAAANTAPTVTTAPTNQTVGKNVAAVATLVVNDAEQGAAAVVVTATSSNQAIVANGSIVVTSGSGGNRTITATPVAGATGSATINFTLSDGVTTTPGSYTVTFTNAAPVISSTVIDQSYTQNVAISALTLPAATDSNVSDTVTYSVSTLPAGLSFNPATRQVTGTPTASGTVAVTYTATDASGATDAKTFNMIVGVAHTPPIMNNVPDQTPATGTAFSLNLSGYVTPTNGDAILGYAVATGTLPPGLSLNTATGAVTGTPTTVGTYNVTVLAFDTDGNSNTDAIAFNVTDGIAPTVPTITAGYASSTNANSVAVEVNGEIGAMVWVNGASTGSAVTGTGKVTINLDTSGADGVKNFSVTLKDGTGNESSAATVSITKDATGPSMSAVGYSTTAPTASAVVATVTTAENLTAPSGWAKSGSGPYTFTKSYAANTTETVTFSDALGNPTNVSVSITNIDTTPPTTLSMPSSGVTQTTATVTVTVNETGTGYYLIQAAAAGAPTSASLVLTGIPVALTANSAQALNFSGLSPNTPYAVYFVAKDALGNTQLSPGSVSFSTLALANTAPTVSVAPTNQSVGKNVAAVANMTVADTESGAAAVVVTATSSNQSLVKDVNVVVSSGSGGARTVTVTPEAGVTGTVTVNYVLSDGTLTTNGSFDVTFTNAAPVISSTVSNQSYNQSTAITALTLPAATDANVGDTVTYSVSALPAGLSFNPATRQITGTPTAAGTTTVTYTATDASGATDAKSFDIAVSANAAPVIGSLPGLASGLGMSFTQPGLTLSVSDTGPITVSISADNGGSINITNANGGSVSGNGTSNVTITGATSGSIVFNYTSPSSDANGWGGEFLAYTATDSGGLQSSQTDTLFY